MDPNPGSHGPYAHTKDGLWVGYDDEEIAREKVITNCELAMSSKLSELKCSEYLKGNLFQNLFTLNICILGILCF